MRNPGLPEALWRVLDGGLWHATDRRGLEGILTNTEIRVAQSDRYREAFCRHAGGLCLFDFGPTAEHVGDQFRNWQDWFGGHQGTRIPIWLRINRERLDLANFWNAARARAEWQTQQGRMFIPGVEACHIGALSAATIDAVVVIDHENRELFRECQMGDQIWQEVDGFEQRLPPPRDDSLIQRLLQGRERMLRGERKDK